MSGALKLPGVLEVEIKRDQKDFKVVYDPELVTVEQMLAALEKAKEPASVIQ